MKSGYFLNRIVIEGFRGINNEGAPLDLHFQPDTVNSIFAVNGIGKSSIFEALEYAIRGRIRKLAVLHSREQANEYYINHFHSKKISTIGLEFTPTGGGETVRIQVTTNSKGERSVTNLSGVSNPQVFLDSLKEDFVLLDGRTFNEFIEDKPLNRARNFSSLLGLQSYSKCSQALQTVSRTTSMNSDLGSAELSKKVNILHDEIDTVIKEIRSTYKLVVDKPLDDIGKLDQMCGNVVSVLSDVESLRDILNDRRIEDVDFEQVKLEIDSKSMDEKQSLYRETRTRLDKLNKLVTNKLDKVKDEQKQIHESLNHIEGLLSKTMGDGFKQLFESARNVFAQEDWTDDAKCPLCKSSLVFSIQDLIARELEQYSKMIAELNQIHHKWMDSNWRKQISEYELSKELQVKQEDYCVLHFDSKFENGKFSQDDLVHAQNWTEELDKMAVEALATTQAMVQELEREMPTSYISIVNKILHAQKFKEATLRFRHKSSEVAVAMERLSIRNKWANFVSMATDLFSDAEESLSTARLHGIAAEFKFHFQEIMKVKNVSPNLQRVEGHEELLVRLENFHGKSNLSASSILSESYRNAVAISIFLAAALKHSGVPRFVVMDDVTSSFDSGHQLYLLELIRKRLQQPNNPDGLQFIILSHDGSLKKYFDSLDGAGNWSHMTLVRKGPNGMVWGNNESEGRIKKKLESLFDAGEISDAGTHIRLYLEFKLMQIIRKVNIPVPLNFSSSEDFRTISRCFQAIESSILLHRDAGNLALDDERLNDVGVFPVPIQIGNFLSHYESGSAASLSESFLRGVIESVDEFADCFMYSDVHDKSSRRWYKSLAKKR